MNELGKMLFVFGVGIAFVGLMLWSGFGKGWLGRLTGNLHCLISFMIYSRRWPESS